MSKSGRIKGCHLQSIILEVVGEHQGELKSVLQNIDDVSLEFSQSYASQSHGIAERLMQEISLRERVILIGTIQKDQLWAESMYHGKWLRNGLPLCLLNDHLPTCAWKRDAFVSFKNIPIFGQEGYELIYRPQTAPNMKRTAGELPDYLLGMESDELLCRVYDTERNHVQIVGLSDLKLIKQI